MNASSKIRVAVNGYGVIGKRLAEAVACQDDMELAGVSDIGTDWRPRMATQKGFRLYGATDASALDRDIARASSPATRHPPFGP